MISAVLLIAGLNAQTLKNFSVPKGYEKIAEAKGDLDKDGKEETVLIYNTDEITTDEEGTSTEKDYKRVFYILKNENGALKVWKKNSTLLFSSRTGFSPEYNSAPQISIKNNALALTQEFNTNSRHTLAYTHTFRFQNGDFYLIGSRENFDDTCEFNILHEINFSTGKGIVDEQYHSCFEGEKAPQKNFYKEFTQKLNQLVKMDDFKIGDHSFKIPGSKKDFIF